MNEKEIKEEVKKAIKEINEVKKKTIEKMKKLEEGFEVEETKDGMSYDIYDKYHNDIIFGHDLNLAKAFIGIKNKDLEMVKEAFDGNEALWEEIFSDSAENVEIIGILDSRNILCKVSTEHGNLTILRVTSYVAWEPDGSDGWPAWNIHPW